MSLSKKPQMQLLNLWLVPKHWPEPQRHRIHFEIFGSIIPRYSKELQKQNN